MPDDFDSRALLAALDATEAAGVPPHLVERLRELVGPIRIPPPDTVSEPAEFAGRRLRMEWRDGTVMRGDPVSIDGFDGGWDCTFEALGRRFVFRLPLGPLISTPRPAP